MEQSTNNAYLLTGGNMGDRMALLAAARQGLAQTCGTILRQSSVYETEAWGKTDQPPFLNQVLEISTSLLPLDLLAAILNIERQLGRERAEKYGPRLMDIDILLFNESVISLPSLVVPHPHMSQRRFVLAPLAELIPDYVHPVTQITISDMLAQCNDPLQVYKM